MSTNVITLPKIEYERLIKISERFELLKSIIEPEFFSEPPSRNTGQMINEFKKSNKYNNDFISSLEQGLKESAYFSNK